jgi:hypothetical protein
VVGALSALEMASQRHRQPQDARGEGGPCGRNVGLTLSSHAAILSALPVMSL